MAETCTFLAREAWRFKGDTAQWNESGSQQREIVSGAESLTQACALPGCGPGQENRQQGHLRVKCPLNQFKSNQEAQPGEATNELGC